MRMRFLTKHQHTKCVKIKELDEEEDLVVNRPFVRAALIVLLQHRIVLAKGPDTVRIQSSPGIENAPLCAHE
jgi:hypothetical protein